MLSYLYPLFLPSRTPARAHSKTQKFIPEPLLLLLLLILLILLILLPIIIIKLIILLLLPVLHPIHPRTYLPTYLSIHIPHFLPSLSIPFLFEGPIYLPTLSNARSLVGLRHFVLKVILASFLSFLDFGDFLP